MQEQTRLRSIDIVSLLSPRSAWRLMRGMTRAVFDDHYAGSPLGVCWFTNFNCNAHCHFCCKTEEIRAGRHKFPPLDLERAVDLLHRIRHSVSMLYLSGGEPLLHPHLLEILKTAQNLKYDSVGISSNLITLDENLEILEYIDAIGVSIHSADVDVHARNLGVPRRLAERAFANLEMLRQEAPRRNIRVLVNCVINRENLATVMDMLEFSATRGFLLELVPANEHGRIPRDLHQNPDYIKLIDQLIELRRQGQARNLAGSTHYYEAIRDFKTFRCFPYGIANILPDGRLCTPCDVSEQYAINVLDFASLKDAIQSSYPHLGKYPCPEGCCFKAGIIERSRLFGLLASGWQGQETDLPESI